MESASLAKRIQFSLDNYCFFEMRLLIFLSLSARSRLTQLAKKGIDALADEEKKDAIAELGDVKIEVTDKDKDERKAYHMLVKKAFVKNPGNYV